MKKTLLQVKNLRKEFAIGDRTLVAVKDLSFSISHGEVLGLVGESGCGKSTLGKLLLRLCPPTRGEVLFEGTNLFDLPKKEMKKMRRKMQMIFQDPYASLNPRMTVLDIVGEAFDIHRIIPKQQRREQVQDLLKRVGLDPDHSSRYPHEFSGGQRQRIGIARALAVEPHFLVCDEPVSSLDVSIQAQIIQLLKELQKERGLTYLFIAHDLAMVEYVSDHIAVMYLGNLVELAPSEEICSHPKHPYTQALISSVPVPDPKSERSRSQVALSGEVPNPLSPPRGCAFHSRCPFAKPICKEVPPKWREVKPNHSVACHLF